MNEVPNSVHLMGRLGQDPDVKTLSTGKKLVNLRLATSETFYNTKGERVTETQWHNLVAWNKQAEMAEQSLKKAMKSALKEGFPAGVISIKRG